MLDLVLVNHQLCYYKMDVTGFVQTQLAGDKTATFVLTNPTDSNIRLFLSNQVSMVNSPELILSTQSSSEARMTAMQAPEKNAKMPWYYIPTLLGTGFSFSFLNSTKAPHSLRSYI